MFEILSKNLISKNSVPEGKEKLVEHIAAFDEFLKSRSQKNVVLKNIDVLFTGSNIKDWMLPKCSENVSESAVFCHSSLHHSSENIESVLKSIEK